jgi:hypothetical protein
VDGQEDRTLLCWHAQWCSVWYAGCGLHRSSNDWTVAGTLWYNVTSGFALISNKHEFSLDQANVVSVSGTGDELKYGYKFFVLKENDTKRARSSSVVKWNSLLKVWPWLKLFALGCKINVLGKRFVVTESFYEMVPQKHENGTSETNPYLLLPVRLYEKV